MKLLGVFLLLCVFAANIAAHSDDHPKSHHHVDHQVRHHHGHPIIHPEQKKPQKCPCKCRGNGRGLIVTFNATTKIEGIYNANGRVGVITDIRGSIVVIYSEKRGVAIGFDYKRNVGVFVSNNTISNWRKYLSNAHNIHSVFNWGPSFNTSSVPSNISTQVDSILKSLSPNNSNYADFLRNFNETNTFFEEFSKILSSYNNYYSGGFESFVKRIQAIRAFLNQANNQGNLTRNGNSSIDLGSIFNQTNGIGALNSLLQQLRSRVPLSQILRNHSGHGLLSWAGRFGGENNNFNRFLKRFGEAIKMLQHRSWNPSFISRLIQMYGRNTAGLSNVPSEFRSEIENLSKTFQNSGNSSRIQELQDFFKNLNNQNFSMNGTNISDLLHGFTGNNFGSNFGNIIHLLGLFSPLSAFQNTIPALFEQLFSHMNGTQSSDANSTITHLLSNQNGNVIQPQTEQFQSFLSLISKWFTSGFTFWGSFGQNIIKIFLYLTKQGMEQFRGGSRSFLDFISSQFFMSMMQNGKPMQQAAQDIANETSSNINQMSQNWGKLVSEFGQAANGITGSGSEGASGGGSGEASGGASKGESGGTTANGITGGATSNAIIKEIANAITGGANAIEITQKPSGGASEGGSEGASGGKSEEENGKENGGWSEEATVSGRIIQENKHLHPHNVHDLEKYALSHNERHHASHTNPLKERYHGSHVNSHKERHHASHVNYHNERHHASHVSSHNERHHAEHVHSNQERHHLKGNEKKEIHHS